VTLLVIPEAEFYKMIEKARTQANEAYQRRAPYFDPALEGIVAGLIRVSQTAKGVGVEDVQAILNKYQSENLGQIREYQPLAEYLLACLEDAK
jgi:hypothetical protein